MNSNYRYVRFNTVTGKAYALFLVSWEKDVCKVSAAFCNPNDSFVKSRARVMTSTRMRENRLGKVLSFSMNLPESKVLPNQDFSEILMKTMAAHVKVRNKKGKIVVMPYAPNWARMAFENHNFKFGTGATPEEIEDMKRRAAINAARRAKMNGQVQSSCEIK